MPKKPSTKHPDHRHLRRAADAVAGSDTGKDLWVAVEVKAEGPFDAEVLDSQDAVKAFEKDPRIDNYAIIPCRGERPVLSKQGTEAFIVIEHEPWSPLCPMCYDIPRKSITEMKLVVTYKPADRSDVVTADIPLGRREADPYCRDRKGKLPDAIFFSFEALDKYVFPSLTASYGLKDASKIREQIKKALNEQASTKGLSWSPGE